ncbi:pyrroline-5-carboxylate reductase [Cohnella pontilimi]|uniref:Pyrroline-5-carboxylate reductase n=1 Tax=Cohnella pontilimi TaxID=2564100 RepID=A0A4U0FH07_9BACL|nr:pyrroline-5-carboxylate reductase [Cohnella pontilimi]TJY44296.1 pyrroline-5-carboxylate reductase [Cohnella pontilimi]
MKQASSAIGNVSICFYGAGAMAEAILRGLIEAGLTRADRIIVTNRQNAERLRELHLQYGVVPAIGEQAKQDALRTADIVVLGMKPKDSASALRALAPLLRQEQLIVSAIAGLSIDTIMTLLGGQRAIVRTMPNTSSTIGLGATGISFSSSVSAVQQEMALAMFGAVGIATVVDEPLIEAVNGVSGSGPAYVYYLMEAMISTGVELGLTTEAARELTVQTVRGAAEMVASTGENPEELRRKVTSPGGTTQAAIDTLERYRFQEGMNAAILRCAERAREMGEAIRSEAIES